MGIFKKLFGRDKKSDDPSKDPNMIRLFDAYGREIYITKQAWRKEVLPRSLRDNWNNPDALAAMIVGEMDSDPEIARDMLEPTLRLSELEHGSERSAVLLAIVQMKTGQLVEAKRTLLDRVERHGESALILTNLAKVYASAGEEQRSEETLWRSLELDPNQENGLQWHVAIQRERGGSEAEHHALSRIADMPGSWLALLFLARNRLEEKNLQASIELYQRALERAPNPPPVTLLSQLSGDLGNAGYIAEIPPLIDSRFDPSVHGLMVGNNLIKAHVELGNFDAARRILDDLHKLKRPDWSKTLEYWDREVSTRKLKAAAPMGTEPTSLAMGTIEGPVWLPQSSPARSLLSTPLSSAPMVAFVGSTIERYDPPAKLEMKLADGLGQLSRAIPLFLAEQAEFHLGVRAQTFTPWFQTPTMAFAVLPGHQPDSDMVRIVTRNSNVSFLVTSHLVAKPKGLNLLLRVIRCSDLKCVVEFEKGFSLETAGENCAAISRQLLAAIESHLKLPRPSPPPLYQIPPDQACWGYLYGLENLLAVRLSALADGENAFLSSERSIFTHQLQLCLDFPKSLPARLILIQTFRAMRNTRPNVAEEFKDKIELLQNDHPLDPSAHAIVQTLLEEQSTPRLS